MGGQRVSVGGRAGATEFRDELLGRLGLSTDANDQDVETAHNGLVEFLDLAPHEVRSWAKARVADADEALVLLSGPAESMAAAAAQAGPAAADGPGDTFRTAAPAAPAAPRPWRARMLWAGVPLVVAAVVVSVYNVGNGSEVPGSSGKPTNQQSAQSSQDPSPAAIDQAKVGVLMQKISADPKDIASLQSLGDIYFAAADYKTASGWEQKILAIEPKNQVALLALGSAQFNQGNKAEAKKHWLVAAALYPKLAEAHYDLGFLYLSQEPPDMAKATAEWNKVIAIDPDSSIAKTVATHLKGLQSPAPDASAEPTPN